MLAELFQWLIETISTFGYLGIIVLMAIESSVLPLPSELVIPPAGYLVAKGEMNGWLVVLCGAVGSILGALVNYAGALYIGEPILRRYGRYFFISMRTLDKSEAFFRRHGEVSTFTGRLIPGVRHLISIPAGLARMNLARFMFFTGLGAGLWCAILAYIGWLLGKHEAALKDALVQDYVHRALLIVLPMIIVLILVYVWWQRRRPTDAR